MIVLAQIALHRFGAGGLYSLAALMGVTDVDPFILGLAQTPSAAVSASAAAMGIVVAAGSNNLLKGLYALVFAERSTGREGLVLMLALAVLGVLLPCLLIR